MDPLASRLARREAIRRAFSADFVTTGSTRDIVRRSEVYLVCLKACKLEVLNPAFAAEVVEVARELGAVPVRPRNVASFSRVRRKDAEWKPPRKFTNAEISKLRKTWYAKIASGDVLPETASGYMPRLPTYDAGRAEINGAVFQQLADHYWAKRRELDIFGLYALEGLSVREIGARLGLDGLKKSAVHDLIARFRAEMRGQTGVDQESGDEPEEGASGDVDD